MAFGRCNYFLVVVIALFGLSFGRLSAQVNETEYLKECTYVLSGKVLDEHDNSPLPYAGIYITELSKGVLSDSLGYFTIEGLCNREYSITVSHIGCDPVTSKIFIGSNMYKVFYTEHHSEYLNTVNIHGHHKDFTTQRKEILDGMELYKRSGVTLGDAMRSLNGVTVFSTGNSIAKPVINGMHSNRIQVINNGVKQEGQQWGVEHAPEVDPFTGDQLELIKGAAAVRYGADAIAGVIKVKPKPMLDTVGVSGEVNMIGFSNGRQGVFSSMLEGRSNWLRKLSWRANGTLKKGGNTNAPDYVLGNTGVEEYNYSGTLNWRSEHLVAEVYYSSFNTKLGIYSESHISNLTDLLRAFERDKPAVEAEFSYDITSPFQLINHDLFKANVFFSNEEIGEISTIYSRQYNHRREFDVHGGENEPALDLELTTHNIEALWKKELTTRFVSSLGVNLTLQKNTYEGRFFVPNFRSNTNSMFWIGQWRGDKFSFEGGARYDYKSMQSFFWVGDSIADPKRNFANTSGTLGMKWHYDPRFELGVNLSSAWRAPTINELYSNGLHHGSASFEVGNEALVSEKAYRFSLDLGYDCQCNSKIKAEVSAYYNMINDFIYLKAAPPSVLTIRGAFPRFKIEQIKVGFYGVDASFTVRLIRNLFVHSSASLLNAKERTEGIVLQQVPASSLTNSLVYEFKSISRLLEPFVELELVSVFRKRGVDPSLDYVPPPDAYNILNMNIGGVLEFKNSELNIVLSGQNVSNVAYRDYMARFRYYADAIGRNIAVKIKYKF